MEKIVIAVQLVTNLVLLAALLRASRTPGRAVPARARTRARDVAVPGQVDLELLRVPR